MPQSITHRIPERKENTCVRMFEMTSKAPHPQDVSYILILPISGVGSQVFACSVSVSL